MKCRMLIVLLCASLFVLTSTSYAQSQFVIVSQPLLTTDMASGTTIQLPYFVQNNDTQTRACQFNDIRSNPANILTVVGPPPFTVTAGISSTQVITVTAPQATQAQAYFISFIYICTPIGGTDDATGSGTPSSRVYVFPYFYTYLPYLDK